MTMTPQTLYHYTSLESLFHMINGVHQKGQDDTVLHLFGSHTTFLNDMTEGKLLPNVLNKLGISIFTIDILQKCSGYPFIVSFTELNDDLNQWRCYGNDGFGVSIGLDVQNLKMIEKKFDKCIYTTEEELQKEIQNNIKGHMPHKNGKTDITDIALLLSNYVIYKHKSFSAELEWRLYETSLPTGYRVSKNLVVPYYDFKIPFNCIESITLGPKCDFDKNKFALELLVKSIIHNNNIKIQKSSIPLQ